MKAASLTAPRTRRPTNVRRHLIGYLFALPWLINLVVLTAFPVAAAFYYSLQDFAITNTPIYVGTENFVRLFTEDDLVWISMFNTTFYAFVAVPIGLVISLLIALLLNEKVPGISFFRTVIYLPSIVPTVATAALWLWVLNPQYGILNDMLMRIGIQQTPGWLTDPFWVRPSYILISLWGVGPTVVIFLAGLQDVPPSLHEAAQIDGANTIQRFFNVTLPMITPTIFFNLITGIIGGFQIFALPLVIGQSPLNSGLFFVPYLYDNAFKYSQMGYASALAIVLFVITLVLTGVLYYSSRRWVYYESNSASN